MRQARDGMRVREVKIPLPPEDSGQITDILISTIGPRTRVIRFSGITSPTGLLLPVHEICEAARSKGVVTVVNGDVRARRLRILVSAKTISNGCGRIRLRRTGTKRE